MNKSQAYRVEVPDPFVGRQPQVDWLAKIIFSHPKWKLPIVISGPAACGKSAVAAAFLHQHRDRVVGCWGDTSKHGMEAMLQSIQDHGRSKKAKDRRVIAVLDDLGMYEINLVWDFIGAAQYFDAVQAVIVTTGRELSIDKAPVMNLSSFGRAAVEDLMRYAGVDLPETLIEELIVRTGTSAVVLSVMAAALKSGGLDGLTNALKQPLYDVNQVFPDNKSVAAVKPQIIFVAGELIEALKKEPDSIYRLSSRDFEKLLAQLLESLGMKIELTQASKDGGCDIIARLNTEIGRFLCVVEAKRYAADNKVGVEIVKQLYATFCQKEATTGLLITTSSFTRGAYNFQRDFKYQLSLKDYTDVSRWIQDYKPDNKTGLFLPD